MALFRTAALLCLLFDSTTAKPAPKLGRRAPSATTSEITPAPTACGDVIDQANNGTTVFWASEAFACLTSVPFNDAVALRFINYLNSTMQFQSTLAYAKNPPAGYQQPAVDFFSELDHIKQNVTAGYYKNQYAFETEVQSLIYSLHDMHVDLTAGILSTFSFGSPYEIAAVSSDGKETPQIYFTGDLLDVDNPTPITKINGEDAIDFLTRFAALNSAGTLEPHADWNQLMSSPILDIQNYYNTFTGGGTFYPGDNLTFTFADGTETSDRWISLYSYASPTGPLTTGGDYYNFFVLGQKPASYDSALPNDDEDDDYEDDGGDSGLAVVEDIVTNWYNASFGAFPPNPDVAQADLSSSDGGIVTGYFLNDTATGVLSIPTFDMYDDYVQGFTNATTAFITRAHAAGMKRIVIDLQQNDGGLPLLALDLFKKFFPQLDPFAGSRRRSFELANIIGNATTTFWDALAPGTDAYDDWYDSLAADEWVITDRLNAATDANFTSWAQYAGPGAAYGDAAFTLTERYNLSSSVFDGAAFDGWSLPRSYAKFTQHWAADDIVLLTDGLCSSTCALFVELMAHQAGVRTVVAGGLPSTTGPMQAAAGSRGARVYSADLIDVDIAWLDADRDPAAAAALAPYAPQRDPGMVVTYAGINLRDQVRDGEAVPLQFTYQAADCRIWYTVKNLYNMTRLWEDAARAIWEDQELCVEGSTGYAAGRNATAARAPPKSSAEAVSVAAAAQADDVDINVQASSVEAGVGTSIQAGGVDVADYEDGDGAADGAPYLCDTTQKKKSNYCGTGYAYRENMAVKCPGKQKESKCVCLKVCRGAGKTDASCLGELKCREKTYDSSKCATQKTTSKVANKDSASNCAWHGVCRLAGGFTNEESLCKED